MLNKMEQFQQWRGTKAGGERDALNSALLMNDYVNSVDSLGLIKRTVAKKFKEFDQYQSRLWGVLVFTKLFIDEAMVQLNEDADTEKGLLTHANAVISSLYENPKQDTSKNIFVLTEHIEKLFALEEIRFTDKKQYKNFIFSSALLFHIIRLSLEELDWASKIIVALIVDIDQMKLRMSKLLQKADAKIEQLEQLAPQSDTADTDPLKPIKNRLNKRYAKVLQYETEKKLMRQSIFVSLTELEKDTAKVSSGISNLRILRGKKGEIEAQIKSVGTLLAVAEENDQKIAGRKYFLNFIEGYPGLLQTLLDNSEETEKKQFMEKVEQLKSSLQSPDLSSGIMNGVNWVTSPLTLVYRTTTPQIVQDIITARLPATLDSLCKVELKELAKKCLLNLETKLKKKEHQMMLINNRLFSQDEDLKQLIESENLEQLVLLQKANDAIKEAVHGMQKVLVTVKKNLHFLNDLQEKSGTLKAFIRLHDGILVKIFNFLARFFTFFKTDTAKLIDEASVLKKQVDDYTIEYQSVVAKEMRQILNNPELDQSIKINLSKQLNVEENEMSQEKQNRIIPNKHNVRLLISTLSQLLATNPHPVEERLNIEKEKNDGEMVLGCP